MTAVTQGTTKEITTVSGCKLYHLTSVQDGYTLIVPFGTIYNIQVTNRTSSASVVAATATGSTITIRVASGTVDVDLMVWGN